MAASSVAQRHVEQAGLAAGRARRRPPRRPRTGTGGGQRPQRQLGEQRGGHVPRRPTSQRSASAAGMVEPGCRIVSRRRWNAPPSGKAAGWSPYHDATSAVPSCASRARPRRAPRAAADLDHERHAAPPATPGTADSSGGDRRDPSVCRGRAAAGQRLGARAPGPGALQQHRGQHPTAPSPNTHDRLAEHRTGVERELQRGLDEREQRRQPRVDGRRRARRRRRPRRRRSGPGAGGTRTPACPGAIGAEPSSLDVADAAVAVAERIAERAAERADRLVEREVGVELARGRRAARCRR